MSVRRVSDHVARLAASPGMDEELQKMLLQKQREISRFRQTVAHLVEVSDFASGSVAVAPPRRQAQQGG